MERIVKDKDISINTAIYQEGLNQFQVNFTHIIQKARKRNIPVVLSELVSNIKDLPPLETSLAKTQTQSIDIFNKAKQLQEIDSMEEAKALFYKAKDLDVIRFRAPEACNDILHTLSLKYKLPLVPMKTYFEKASPDGLIGNNLMLDHLHPNVKGYFLMADAFFNTLKEHKIIAAKWDSINIKTSDYYQNHWGFTALDSFIGDLNIKFLKAGWPFKPANVQNNFIETYHYSGFIDSMAFAYVKRSSKHIEDEHIKLAHYFFARNLNENAFNEYLSLIKIHPYIADLYYDASKYLIAQNKFKEALDLILSGPFTEKTYFYYYMTGTLKIKTGDLKQAINDLEYALKIITPDAKAVSVLMPLYIAYKNIGDIENAKRVGTSIQKYIPSFGLEARESNDGKVSLDEAIARAEAFIENKEYDKAEKLLLATNKIKETFLADKLMGSMYIMQQKNELAYVFCSKAHKLNPYEFENLNNFFVLCLIKNDLHNASLVLDELKTLNIDRPKIQRLTKLYENKKKELEVIKK